MCNVWCDDDVTISTCLKTFPKQDYDCIIMQGSGTYGNEAMLGICSGVFDTILYALGSIMRPGEKLLVLRNGLYGDRLRSICERLNIAVKTLVCRTVIIMTPGFA